MNETARQTAKPQKTAKPAPALIKLTLYGEDNEIAGEYERSHVPWGILKRAKNLMPMLNTENPLEISDEVFDALGGLVVEVFDNKFTVDDLNRGADVGDMIAILMTIMSKASALMPGNPTTPPKRGR